MRKTRTSKIRTEMSRLIKEAPEGAVVNHEIVARLKSIKCDVVKEEIDGLVDKALSRIFDEVFKWKCGAQTSAQLDLFDKFKIPERYCIRKPGSSPVRLRLEDMTFADAISYLAQYEEPKKRKTPKAVAELNRYISAAQELGAKPDEKLMHVWERIRGKV